MYVHVYVCVCIYIYIYIHKCIIIYIYTYREIYPEGSSRAVRAYQDSNIPIDHDVDANNADNECMRVYLSLSIYIYIYTQIYHA